MIRFHFVNPEFIDDDGELTDAGIVSLKSFHGKLHEDSSAWAHRVSIAWGRPITQLFPKTNFKQTT